MKTKRENNRKEAAKKLTERSEKHKAYNDASKEIRNKEINKHAKQIFKSDPTRQCSKKRFWGTGVTGKLKIADAALWIFKSSEI